MERFGRTGQGAGRMRLEAASDDVDEARDMFQQAYGSTGWRATPTDEPFRYRHFAAGTDAITLRTTTFRGLLHGSHETTDEYIVDWLKSGTGILDEGRSDVPVARTPRLHPTTHAYDFTYTDFEQNLVHLNRRFVEQLAAERDGGDPRPIVFDHDATVSDGAVARWWTTIEHAATHFLRPSEPNAIVDADVSRRVATAFLNLFPHEVVDLPPALLSPRRTRLRAALEFIEANARFPITSTEIAQAAGTSVRALQQSFQREFEVSPSEYLRGVRLDRVRTELLQADPDTTTVAEIARAWGFAHLGRFSGTYVERFGEYPRHTIRRAA